MSAPYTPVWLPLLLAFPKYKISTEGNKIKKDTQTVDEIKENVTKQLLISSVGAQQVYFEGDFSGIVILGK